VPETLHERRPRRRRPRGPSSRGRRSWRLSNGPQTVPATSTIQTCFGESVAKLCGP
jgi:hypothetical protein